MSKFHKGRKKEKKKISTFLFFAKKIAMTTVFDGVVYLFIHFLSLPKNYIFFPNFYETS